MAGPSLVLEGQIRGSWDHRVRARVLVATERKGMWTSMPRAVAATRALWVVAELGVTDQPAFHRSQSSPFPLPCSF